MFFLTPILAGLIIAGTIGAGAVVEKQAQDVVSQYNLAQIAHFLEINSVDTGKYPQSLNELVNGGEIKNIEVENYKYSVSINGQKAAVYDGKYCWNSEVGVVRETIDCQL